MTNLVEGTKRLEKQLLLCTFSYSLNPTVDNSSLASLYNHDRRLLHNAIKAQHMVGFFLAFQKSHEGKTMPLI